MRLKKARRREQLFYFNYFMWKELRQKRVAACFSSCFFLFCFVLFFDSTLESRVKKLLDETRIFNRLVARKEIISLTFSNSKCRKQPQ